MLEHKWLTSCAVGIVLLASCTAAPRGPETTPAATAASTPGAAPPSVAKIDDEALPSPPATRLEAGAEPPAGASVGDLLVAPTRLVFEDGETTAEVSLINIGQARGTYRISLVEYEMTETGALSPVDAEANAASARRMIRYSPRQVTLDPRMVQTIRVQVRRPSDLEAGEYRSHFLFQSIPPPQERAPETPQTEPEGVRIELRPIFGISIPVIVRHRTGEPSAALSEVRLVRDGETPAIELRISRRGDTSSYGRLQASWIPRDGSAPRVIGLISGVAVYPPLTSRSVRIPLQTPQVPTGGGTIRVTYSDEEELEGRILAEASVEVP